MDDHATERELIRRGLAVIVATAPAAPLLAEATRDRGAPQRRKAVLAFSAGLTAILIVVGMVPFLTRGARNDQESLGVTSNDVAAIVAGLGECIDPIGDPILLPDLFSSSGTWWVVAPGDIDLSPLRVEAGDPVIPAFGDSAELIGVIGSDPSVGMDLKMSSERQAVIEALAGTDDRVIVRTSVGGDRSRDYSTSRQIAHVGFDGSVSFAGNCARELFTDQLRSFHSLVGWDGTEEDLLRALVVDRELQTRLDDHVYN